jgi:hypothetical protein
VDVLIVRLCTVDGVSFVGGPKSQVNRFGSVLLAPLAILLARAPMRAEEAILQVGAAIGVLAALVQFLGLIR